MILKQFRQYTINGVSYTSLRDIRKSLNLTHEQLRYKRKKDPNWLVVVKGPVGVKSQKKEYYIGNGVIYSTLSQAALAHGITKEAVRRRIMGRKWHWFKVVDGVQQPKVMQSIDKTSYYYRKKNGIKKPRPTKYKKHPVLTTPIPKPKVLTTPIPRSKVLTTPGPRNLSEFLDEMFAKKEAKKS